MTSLPSFGQILHTGQVLIPVGSRAFSINVMSGSATVAGVGYIAGQTVNWTAADSRLYLGGSVAVGATGVNNRTAVFWTT